MTPFNYVWMNGNFVTSKDATVPILTHTLHYGTGVFEGIRAYPVGNDLIIFRLQEHMERLIRSAKMVYLNPRYTADQLSIVTVELMRKNEVRRSAYIRPIIFTGSESLDLDLRKSSIHAAIVVIPFDKYFEKDGLKACISNWRKISDSSSPTKAKASGNYLNCVLAKTEAGINGYDEALLLSQDGTVCEGSGENIFIVRNRELYTPPLSSPILAGITRDSIITLARDDGMRVFEKEITRAELYSSDEVFLTGTAAEVSSVVEIDERKIGNGRKGPITTRIQELFSLLLACKLDKYFAWLTHVYTENQSIKAAITKNRQPRMKRRS